MDKKKGYFDHILPVFTGEEFASLMNDFQKSKFIPLTDEERNRINSNAKILLERRKRERNK